MLKRTLISALTFAVLAAVPAAASAPDTVVVPGADAQQLAALDGAVVWVAGSYPNNTLMRRTRDGKVARVPGSAIATYRSIDLGHDGHGKLVLTYLRCHGSRNCEAFSDDLHGHHASFGKLVPQRCDLTAAPARWGPRIAYGLSCDKLTGKPNRHDATRSGLFVRTGTAKPRHLRLPAEANRFGIDHVRTVDLRGTNVGAVVADVYTFAVAETIAGTRLRSSFIAVSEGDSDENVYGSALGNGGVLWTLIEAVHVGGPNEARISRLNAAHCTATETQDNPLGPGFEDGFRAEALAVDGDTLYLWVRGVGIVTHVFAPAVVCA